MEPAMSDTELRNMISSCIIPPLSYSIHKGDSGKIGVIGGSEEYSGAPFYAGMTALKTGADLVHIFCAPCACSSIKSYSPELIVHPSLTQDSFTYITRMASVLNAFVIGPGLGRNDTVTAGVKTVIADAMSRGLPIVLDGDGVQIVVNDPGLVKGYPNAVLTPNVNEYTRLCNAVGIPTDSPAEKLADFLGGVTIIQKGQVDVITNGKRTVRCATIGCPRRCGGQGDLLAGCLGTFLAWAYSSKTIPQQDRILVAGYAACTLIKKCANMAFAINMRSTSTTDMLKFVGEAFREEFHCT